MEIKNIEELARIMKESQLTRLEISEDGVSVRLERQAPAGALLTAELLGNESAQKSAAPFTRAGVDGSETGTQTLGTLVASPTVGVFYTAPSPESEPFVKVGDKVKKGDVLCIIEAMKLMNEIPAELDGTVAEICASNGQVVEYNQPLFRIV